MKKNKCVKIYGIIGKIISSFAGGIVGYIVGGFFFSIPGIFFGIICSHYLEKGMLNPDLNN